MGWIALCRDGLPEGYPFSAMRPIAQHQHASSRAVATLALLLWTPRSSIAARLSTSLRTPLAAVSYTHLTLPTI